MMKYLAITTCLLAAIGLYGFLNSKSLPQNIVADEQETVRILTQISSQFSAAYVQGDNDKLISFYTDDAVIFPGNSDLIKGKEAIRKYWTLPQGRIVSHHKNHFC